MEHLNAEQSRILVIDDEEIILKSMRSILKLEGYAIDTASSAAEGLGFVRKNSYEIIFLDLKLPDTNGIDVLKDIRKFDAEAAVIIITGYATVKSAISAMKMHAYDYILKPLDPDQIRGSLKTAFKKKKYEAELKKKIAEPRILLIGTASDVIVAIAQKLLKEKMQRFLVRGSKEAIQFLRKDPSINTVLYDLECEKGEAAESRIELLDSAKKVNPEIIFIPITSRPDLQDVIDMLKRGAWDFLVRPVKDDDLFSLLRQAWNSTNLTFINRQLMFELQRSNEELQKFRSYVTQIMRTADSGIIVLDREHKISMVNAACCAWLGYPEKELVDTPASAVFDEHDSGKESAIETLLKREESRGISKICRAKNGDRIPVLISTSSLFNDQGEIIGAVLIGRPEK